MVSTKLALRGRTRITLALVAIVLVVVLATVLPLVARAGGGPTGRPAHVDPPTPPHPVSEEVVKQARAVIESGATDGLMWGTASGWRPWRARPPAARLLKLGVSL